MIEQLQQVLATSLAALQGPLEMALETALAVAPPGWVLAVVLAALNVFVFHIAAGAERHSALFFIPFGICGFALGNLLASWSGSPLPMLGDLHVIEASASAWALLTLANGFASPAKS